MKIKDILQQDKVTISFEVFPPKKADGLEAVEKVQNPEFTKTLFDNASCDYCRSHQYELARHWYAERMRKAASRLAIAVASHERNVVLFDDSEDERKVLMGKPLESLRPTRPRTEANFRATMRSIAEML